MFKNSPNMNENFKKRNRTVLTRENKLYLEIYFEKNRFPSTTERTKIAKKMSVKPRTIQIWFQNARQKLKNDNIFNQYKNRNKIHNSNLYKLAIAACRILEKRNSRNV